MRYLISQNSGTSIEFITEHWFSFQWTETWERNKGWRYLSNVCVKLINARSSSAASSGSGGGGGGGAGAGSSGSGTFSLPSFLIFLGLTAWFSGKQRACDVQLFSPRPSPLSPLFLSSLSSLLCRLPLFPSSLLPFFVSPSLPPSLPNVPWLGFRV